MSDIVERLQMLAQLRNQSGPTLIEAATTIATLRKALELAYYASTLTQARETIRDALDRAALGNSKERKTHEND